MKKIFAVLCIFIGIFCMTTTVSADSPLTSTNFSKAYYDLAMVRDARDQGVMNSDFADYLADENNPIDVKAAVINALSWDIDGKTNAETYCQLIYEKSLMDLDITSLSGDQQFCIGYLLALDDYFDTAQAMEYLQLARSNRSDSFTVAIITFLVEAMNMQFDDVEHQFKELTVDNTLTRDLPDDALVFIIDYMVNGIDIPVEHAVDIPKTGVLPLELIFGIGAALTATGITLCKKRMQQIV